MTEHKLFEVEMLTPTQYQAGAELEELTVGQSALVDRYIPLSRVDETHYFVGSCGQQVCLERVADYWLVKGYAFAKTRGLLGRSLVCVTAPIYNDDPILFNDIDRAVEAIGKWRVEYARVRDEFKAKTKLEDLLVQLRR